MSCRLFCIDYPVYLSSVKVIYCERYMIINRKIIVKSCYRVKGIRVVLMKDIDLWNDCSLCESYSGRSLAQSYLICSRKNILITALRSDKITGKYLRKTKITATCRGFLHLFKLPNPHFFSKR